MLNRCVVSEIPECIKVLNRFDVSEIPECIKVHYRCVVVSAIPECIKVHYRCVVVSDTVVWEGTPVQEDRSIGMLP